LGNDKKADRVAICGTDLLFNPKLGGGLVLAGGHFCRVPLCPLCATRRSQKVFGQVSRIMNYIERERKYRYVFLTLTVKNVKGVELMEMLDKLMLGLHGMVHHADFRRASRGWFRALEITHNWQTDEYHPHFHMVIAVDEEYFNQRKNYMTHSDWRAEWQKCMGLNYEPFVRIQRVKVSKESIDSGDLGYWQAVAEVSKYSTKSMDYMVMWKNRKVFEKNKKVKLYCEDQCLEMTDRAVAVLDEAVHKRRMVAFGGEFKTVHKLLNLDDPENGDLINTDNENGELRNDLKSMLIHYRWNIGLGNYFLVKD
jgi:plasmid rolling circle replication initiator protein Rep